MIAIALQELKLITDSIKANSGDPDAPLKDGEMIFSLSGRNVSVTSMIMELLPKKVFKYTREIGIVYDSTDPGPAQEVTIIQHSFFCANMYIWPCLFCTSHSKIVWGLTAERVYIFPVDSKLTRIGSKLIPNCYRLDPTLLWPSGRGKAITTPVLHVRQVQLGGPALHHGAHACFS